MKNIKHHIYIVDDDDAYRKSLTRVLKSLGFFVESFSAAQTFLDSVPVAFKEGVAILDVRMPGMDGFELQEKMNELRSPLRIIFITAHSQPGDRDHAIKAGAIGFLQKPFQEESLLEVIREAMEEEKDEG